MIKEANLPKLKISWELTVPIYIQTAFKFHKSIFLRGFFPPRFREPILSRVETVIEFHSVHFDRKFNSNDTKSADLMVIKAHCIFEIRLKVSLI